MKGITTSVSVILLVAIVIALAGSAYFFFGWIMKARIAETFEIVDVTDEKIIVRNLGTESINDFKSIVDREEVSNKITGGVIQPNSLGSIILLGISKGSHDLLLTSESMSQRWRWDYLSKYSVTLFDDFSESTAIGWSPTSSNWVVVDGQYAQENEVGIEYGTYEMDFIFSGKKEISFTVASDGNYQSGVSTLFDKENGRIELRNQDTIYKSTSYSFNENTWYSVKVELNEDKNYRLYINGEHISSLDFTVPVTSIKGTILQLGTDPVKAKFDNIKVGSIATKEITFDRNLDCYGCGQHKAPPSTDVKITITATVSTSTENANLIDYYPNEWVVTNANDGTISEYNSTFNKIEWNVGSVKTEISRWYTIRSPQLKIPPIEYYFFSELTNQKSDVWQISVADPNNNFYVSGTDVQQNFPSEVNKNNNFIMVCSYTVASSGGGKKVANNFFIYYQYNSTSQGWRNITNDANFGINDTYTGPYSTGMSAGTYSDNRARSIQAKTAGTYWVRCQIENAYTTSPAQKFVYSPAYSQNVTYIYLEINLSAPSPTTCAEATPCQWDRNEVYWVNASVKCMGTGKNCGDVSGSVRYNVSSTPDTLISTKEGAIPLYVAEPRGTLLAWENVTDYSTGDDSVRRVTTDSQGSVITVGWDYIGSTFNWRVTKYNSAGSELWTNNSVDSRANGVAVDLQDNVIVVGYTGTGASSRWKITKFNALGSLIWENVTLYTGGGGAWAVATDSQDNVIVGGLDNAPGNYEWRIVKYDSVGKMLWENVTNFGSAGDEIFGVETDSQDNIIVVGFTSDTVAGNDQWRTIKYNAAGVMLWENATDCSSGNDIIRDVAVDSQDNVIVAGNDLAPGNVPGNNEWRIVKFNSAGSVLWENVTDYTDNSDIAWGVAVDSQDNVIVTGQENYIVGADTKGRVMKYNSMGSELWSNIVNPTMGDDQIYDVTTDLENNIILGGYDSLSGKEWRVMKYSLMGANLISCGIMPQGNICQLGWMIYVTGNSGEAYKIDVNFTSNSNIWNDTENANIRIYYLPSDTSFRITIPRGGMATAIVSKDVLTPTKTSANICFNASSNSPFPQSNINASNCQGAYQNETVPIIEFNNIGDVSVNFTLYLNQTFIPGVYIRCKDGTFDPYSAVEMGVNPWLVDYGVSYVSPNNVRNVYCWLNVTSAVQPQELTREFRYKTSQS